MCIAFFDEHWACDHHHFMGVCDCGLNCPTDRRHLFCLEDNSTNNCSDCTFLSGAELDPDIVPVQYQPCTMDKHGNRIDPNAPKAVSEQQEVREEQISPRVGEEVHKGYQHSAASLSDLDSETSEWRYEDLPQDYYTATPHTFNATPHGFPNHNSPYTFTSSPHSYYNVPPFFNPYAQLTPRTARHRTLVRGQLQHLSVRPHVVPQPQPQSPSLRYVRPMRRPRGFLGRGHVRGVSGTIGGSERGRAAGCGEGGRVSEVA